MSNEYKLSWDTDDKDIPFMHPALIAYGEGKKLTKVKIVEQVEDDHLPCIHAKMTIGGKVYKIGDYWLNGNGLRLWYQAEVKADVREKLIKRLYNYAKKVIRDELKAHNEYLASQQAKK